MKTLTKLIIAPLMAASLAQSAPSPPTTRKAPIEGYGIVNLQWAIPVTNNYHNNTTGAGALDTRAARAASDTVTVNGTIQNVIAHLAAHHPEYMAAVDASIAAEQEELKKRRRRAAACCHCSHVGDPPAEPKPKPTDPPAEPLPPVDPHLVRSTECNNFRDTKYDVIREGAWYLKGVRGEPVLGPGPGECARVSCSYDNAIWWCNDKMQEKKLESFSLIGDAALNITDKCFFTAIGTPAFSKIGNGQQLYEDDWNVIVGGVAFNECDETNNGHP